MTQRKEEQNDAARNPFRTPRPPRKKDEPDWAEGLRQLYNSVAEEPLPDSFDDLLKKLDKDGGE